MKYLKYYKLSIISIVLGLVILLSTFLNIFFDNLMFINTIILYIPRIVANVIYKGWFEPSKLVFIAAFTFIFYTILSFSIGYFIQRLRKK